jgi:hypothetical protein
VNCISLSPVVLSSSSLFTSLLFTPAKLVRSYIASVYGLNMSMSHR